MRCFVSHLFAGGVGGFLATIPMSAVMLIGHRWLPGRQRDSLPPQQITDEALESVDLDDDLSPAQRGALAVANHFAYGTAVGTLYGGLTAISPPAKPIGCGIAYGLSVWAGSYLGLVPTLGLYRSATREPLGRNALMIAAHVVWGASLGIITERLSRQRHWSCNTLPRDTLTEKSYAHKDEKEYAK